MSTSPTHSEQPSQNPNAMIIQESESNPLGSRTESPKTIALVEPADPHLDDPIPNQINPIQDDPEPISALTPRISDPPTSRRAPKRKKNAHKRRLARQKSQKKFRALVETLKPIPFVPSKTLDFQSHEELLKRLGLWEFVHIEFDKTLRADLLAELVASYNSQNRCSYVNSARINVNRADLARALKLPLPVKKSSPLLETAAESPDSIAFIEDFVSNWMLLHEDTWMMPKEVLNWTKMIKEGHFEKVEWAGLIWFMVEKELLQAPRLANCYYASHLQYLIRSQKDDLLKEEPKLDQVDVEVEEEEDEEDMDVSGDVKLGTVEDYLGHESADVKIDASEDSRGHELGDVKMDEVEDSRGNELADMKTGAVEDSWEHECGNVKMSAGEDSRGHAFRDVDLSVGEDSHGHELRDLKMDAVEESRGHELGDVKMAVVEDSRVHELEEHSIELSLGQDNVERVEEKVESVEIDKERVGDEDVMDFDGCREEYKDEEEGGAWLLDRKSSMGVVGEPFFRRCSVGEIKGLGCDEEKREEAGEEAEEGEDEGQDEEEEGEQEVGGFHLSPKCNPLDGLASRSLIQAMEAAQMPFSTGLELRDHSAGDFLSSRVDNGMIAGSSSLFGNTNKKGLDHENDGIHHSLNGGHKRLRSDGPWDGKEADFDMCMEQVQHWVGKARMMYAAKEQACEEATVNQQILLNELEQRDRIIEHIRTTKYEEQQKKQVEVYRLERELYMMANLLEGYRKALKESDRAFAEYRSRFPQPEEPLYKDVPGSGGLVLSTFELEKQRLKQAEEDRITRLVIEKKFKDVEAELNTKFEAHFQGVDLLGNRLLGVENGVKVLKESIAKRKVSETSEGTPDE
ncbi:hypothetical protein I3843_04G120100 [Carya illinoinensis]|nr:hypothetical protein I3843_04G120100 [Carya illinoinensis]